MRIFARLALGTALVMAAVTGACGEDQATVNVKPDGGAVDAGDAGVELLSCGVVVPPGYDSPAFATNAREELDLKNAFASLDARMKAAEGTSTSIVTAAELQAIYEQGTPSLKSSSTSAAAAAVEGYLTAFGAVAGKTWSPELVGADAGDDAGDAGAAPLTGGKYGGTYYFDATGIDLRQATTRTLLGGALYNHALVLASGPVTEATVDRLLAAYGASTHFVSSSDPDAGGDGDALIADLASQRDDKSKPAFGIYRRIERALRYAKAAAAAGSKCADDLDASIKIFLAEWEKATYASAIFFLNDAASKAIASKGDEALHSLGQAIGLVQSFRGIAPDRRKITDANIDDLLAKIGASSAYALVTTATSSARVNKLVEAINDLATLYGWTPAEVTDFERQF